MKLAQLLSIYPQLNWGEFAASEVTSLCDDSRKVEKGSVFVAVRGLSSDGHQFLHKAIESGAIALVVENKNDIPENYKGAVVCVPNSRVALNDLASRYFGDPAQGLFCVGVTGTNGKTSVCYMVEQIFNVYGWKTGVMGTIDHHLGGHVWKSELTTPGTLQLQKRLQEFAALGAEATVFEVSSHAIEQKRADTIPFNAVVFTNLSRDHLDYHADMESYFQAKQKLFLEIPAHIKNKRVYAVVNSDDEYGKKLSINDKVKLITVGQREADYAFKCKSLSFNGTCFSLTTPKGQAEINLKVPGIHNVYNATLAIAVAMSAGVSLEKCKQAIEKFKGVPGRLEVVPNHLGVSIFVDYAHTDEALRTVLKNLQKIGKNSEVAYKVLTVFGCGGDRDKGKRPLMMQAAREDSDIVFLTSDNPRTEDPMQIINDALKVVPPNEIDHTVYVDVDRKSAIRRAINFAKSGDVILIAGKGHEDYQIVGHEKIHFSDVEVAQEILGEKEI